MPDREGSVMPTSKNTRLLHGHAMLGASILALATVLGAGAALAQSTSTPMETVVVTGFRQSLEKALDMKRNALDSSDSILATDIAKFPDLNVSESLQRIPGVALERDAGEGREISVRGLGPGFTRVRINGMEALATTGSEDISGGTNRGRAFDFNVFAADLFSALTVHKSASADLEEGSLGATVDMHTAHPFDHPGFVLTGSAQYGYNDLAGSSDPRFAALVSDTLMGGRLGVLVSAAYGIQNTLEDGTSTVRFQNDNTAQSDTHAAPGVAGCASGCSASQRFASVDGMTSGASYDLVNEAFHPRFPRYDLVMNHEKRLGLTSSVQWQPDDDTLFTLDALFADFAVQRQEAYIEANSFSNNFATKSLGPGLPASWGIRKIDVTSFTVDNARNNVTKLTANNVGARVEHRLDHLDTRFQQVTLDGTHSFSDSFKVHGLVGWSESHHRNPIQTTLTYDYGVPGIQNFAYDYSGGYSAIPMINFGSAADSSGTVTSTNNWFLSQIRERAEYDFNAYRTIQGDFSWTTTDWLTLQGGFNARNYGYRTMDLRRSNGSTSNLDSSIPTDMEAADLSKYSEMVSLCGLNLPSGSPTSWMVPDLNKWNAAFNIWDPTSEGGAFKLGPEPSLSSNGSVREDDTGGWLQADWDTMFYGVPFRGNIGARYVETSTTSIGYSYDKASNAVIPTTVKQTYHDVLPSMNAVFEPADDFLVRINASYAMARPDLTNLLPGASASKSGSNYTVKVGNPFLKPFRSKNVDLSFEWYYHKGALLSIAMFYKHIDSLVQTLTSNIVYHGNPYGLPDSLAVAACGTSYAAPPATGCNENAIWQFSEPANSKGSPLYGTEINWQQPFDFLPGPLGNFGFLGNVTFVQAQQIYYNKDGSILTKADLEGLSHTSYNATIYYDDQSAFQARLSAAFRSKYIAKINPGNLNDQEINTSTFNLDASASYKYDENFTLTFDALNLTNQPQNQYVDSVGQRLYYWHQTGREFFLGLRYNY
ncbi:MAG: TonB-dependent receptor [Alphaproteobacteria bacterium]|nr:TonB-dependent receptor [Alphaproteobacteria bacterium]